MTTRYESAVLISTGIACMYVSHSQQNILVDNNNKFTCTQVMQLLVSGINSNLLLLIVNSQQPAQVTHR